MGGLALARAGKPDFVRASAAQGIRDAMTAVQNARRGLLADASILSDFNAELRNVTGQAGSLMNTPADLAARIQDAVGGVRGVAALPSGALAGLRQLFGFRLSVEVGGHAVAPAGFGKPGCDFVPRVGFGNGRGGGCGGRVGL